jgi:hypothetical protein
MFVWRKKDFFLLLAASPHDARLGGARLCCVYYTMKLWKIRWFCKAK